MAKMSDEMKALTALLRLIDKLEYGVASRLLHYALQKLDDRHSKPVTLQPISLPLPLGNGVPFTGHQQ